MIDQFINFVIRPPRADYNPDQYLWEKDFTLAGRKYERLDLEIVNERGHKLQCSHYVPSPFPDGASLPCVIYCHGNSGCRADANEAAVVLLPSNITLFTLDFSGSGLSDGEYVSLGCHEKNDLKVVVSYLRRKANISRVGLWGRSMGAVTCLLYGADDPSIAGMVLDSAFSNLFDLMMELVDVYKIRLPKFTVKIAVQYMRRVIQRKAKFDIMNLNCMQVAPRTFIPALFGHAKDDKFVQPHHSDHIFRSYSGDKNMIKFDGDHNSSRPQFYYDSVSIFFYNVLRPPQLPSIHSNDVEKYYDIGESKLSANSDEQAETKHFACACSHLRYVVLKISARQVGHATRLERKKKNLTMSLLAQEEASFHSFVNEISNTFWLSLDETNQEKLLYKMIDGLKDANSDEGSSSSLPPCFSSTKFVGELLSEINQIPGQLESSIVVDDTDKVLDSLILESKPNGQNEECCSYTSSNRESWGRCSSLGSNDERLPDCPGIISNDEISLKPLTTPCSDRRDKTNSPGTERKKEGSWKKSKREKVEKLEALSQRLRNCILKRVNHRRHCSS